MPKWNKFTIRRAMQNNFAVCRRALIALYRRQTSDEQVVKQTRHDNARGFNAPDAKRGSVLAQKAMTPEFFTPAEIIETRRLLWKYAGQLADIANAKETASFAARLEAHNNRLQPA